MECNYISVCLFCVIQQKGGIKMTRKEAAIRYALENGELDGLKVWLLNGGDIEEYFVKNKKNIKITINEKQFSLSAKEAADIVKGMMPIEFSRQDFVNLYFKLSEEKQEELYNEVFPYYPQVIRTKKNPSSKEILDAVKRKHYIHFPDNFYDILSDEDLAECLLYDESMMHDVPESRWNSELAILFSKKLADKGAYYDRICIPEECQSAVYWENLCKADGYYYRILPEKYKDILSEELILFTLKNSKSYIGPCHLFETIPDELKTAKVSLLCCLKHFAAIEYLPKRYQIDKFYEILSDHGQNSFLNCIHLNTISKELLLKCIQREEGEFGGKIPESYWDEELAVAVAGHTDELKIIPTAWRTKEVYKTFVSKRGTNIEQVPKNAIDEELCLIAMESNSFAALRYIPENMKTDSFWEKVIDRNLFYKVSDLPEKYQEQAWTPEKCRSLSDIPSKLKDEDHVLTYLETRGHILPSDFEEFQTQKIIDHVMSREHNSNSKLWLLKYIEPEFRRRADMQEVLTNCKDAIFLKNLSQDEIRENINAFPKNILFAPDWYEDDIKIPEKYFEPRQQLTLFDFITE
jgi:hypothetical protein